MEWPRVTDLKGLWASLLWAPVLLSLACNGDAVTPPRIIVAGDAEGPLPPCFGVYCDLIALERYGMDPFYRKIVVTHLIPVVGSHQVQDGAFKLAVQIADSMIGDRPQWWGFLVEAGAFLAIMSVNEVTTDIPEHKFLSNDPRTDWDTRARGLGATPSNPITTVGEENLLCLPNDVYLGERILVHEFAHSIHRLIINQVAPTFEAELEATYQMARGEGLWVDTYADENRFEYWAEGVQSWFNANQSAQAGIHNDVNTRDELLDYDPRLHALIAEYFPETSWSPTCPSG